MNSTEDPEISRVVLDLLSKSEPLKAREIATRLDVELNDVNRALYGTLARRVRKDRTYRWSVSSARPRASVKAGSASARVVRAARAGSGTTATEYSPTSGGRAITSGARQLRKALQLVTDETQREMNLTQILMLLRVAEAGDQGIESHQLVEDVGASASAVSRTMRILGRVHYSKRHAGFGLVEMNIDPADNRLRIVKLSPAGRVLVHRVLTALG